MTKYLSLLSSWCLCLIIVMSPLAILMRLDKIEKDLTQPKVIYYQVDAHGAAWHGKVTRKETDGIGYTIEVGTYGRFLVTKEQYDSIRVGDDAPEYLKKRGN